MKLRTVPSATGRTQRRAPLRRRPPAALLAALLTGATLTGCGSSAAPADSVPALGASLDKVDSFIAAGHLVQARSELKTLTATTTQARSDGELSDQDATRILDAAQALLAELPAPSPAQ